VNVEYRVKSLWVMALSNLEMSAVNCWVWDHGRQSGFSEAGKV